MKLLLDTHIVLWFFEGDARLSKKAETAITSLDNKKYVSILSLWEFAIKKGLNKIQTESNIDRLEFLIAENGFELLDLTSKHCKQLLLLPYHRRDSFDRMLIAQAISDDLTILTEDKNFTSYPAKMF